MLPPATAQVAAMGEAKGVAPIAVDIKHPLLQCTPTPCFDQPTTLDLKKTGPGAFRLLNLDDTFGGSGQKILADWIQNGYSDYLPLDWYFQDAGAKFNSSEVTTALNDRLGDELLFPVYDATTGGGSNFEYHVVGWVGFVMTSYDASGSNAKINGYFTEVLWDGLGSTDPSAPTFGAQTVTLVD